MNDINLPLASGVRSWMADLSAQLAALNKLLSSGSLDDATTARLVSAIGELGSRVDLLLVQDEGAHEFALADRPPDAAQQRRFGQSESGRDHIPGPERGSSRYRDLAAARKAAAQAYKKGRAKGRSRRRRRK